MNKSNELIKDIKSQKAAEIEAQVDLIFESVKESESFKEIDKVLSDFEHAPYENTSFYFDEYGCLNATIEVSFHFLSDFEPEVLDSVIEHFEKSFWVCLYQDQYAQDRYAYRADVCLGEPTVFNERPNRDHYAIYSPELDLKVDKVLSEEHGFALIEQAMRRAGVFENIVSIDYCGHFVSFLSVPEKIRTLSDFALSDFIDSIKTGQVTNER